MDDNKFYLTLEGVKRLRQELAHLVNVERLALADRRRHAIQQGDLSDCADSHTVIEEQAFLEARIRQLELMLQDVIIIKADRGPKSEVVLGSRVTVIAEDYDDPETFVIVGTTEADPANGRISNESPVGKALMARKVGEWVAVQTPAKEIAFKITAIE